MSEATAGPQEGFDVAGWMDRLGTFVARHPRLWIGLGDIETGIAAPSLEDVVVDRPVYIAGLARSGSTILLEILARHPHVATHRYRDYPPVLTPYLWNRWLDRIPTKPEKPKERTHRDGIEVTSQSPEAFEEVLWMSFFPELHDWTRSARLGRDASHPEFEAFYRDHIRKLVAVRGRPRYVAKGNYNVTRLAYLQKLAPDARFVLPVRDPVWHIASLMKQQRIFERGQRGNPKARRHLRHVGHFEFGLDRRPINTGDDGAVTEIMRLWNEGREIAGWARYWTVIHDHLADTLERDESLRRASLIIRHDELCQRPRETLDALLAHCELDGAPAFVTEASRRLHPPTYYHPSFSDEETALIRRETAAAARRFGLSRNGA